MTADGSHLYPVRARTPLKLVDNDDLEEVEDWFRVGVVSLGSNTTTAQLVIEAYPLGGLDDDDDSPATEWPRHSRNLLE
ncbi:hypothetical protein [Arthrobacter sp. zg-Y1171]|uniref:hypothetical protein n=1 Tax=Arthrobacter sp. zg-Y1171 TaxID=2964610 RepID=UPI0021025F5C|nr:hypothetical protein [Arthrobacter sp. zg-Y1171]MCQ1996490.1 hypothetical protein [Arthrobacter sp. zg-Y1171]UWX82092.1 hypothetical protein N2L00_01220 [Arthrobacter sp. zg-Y1171]